MTKSEHMSTGTSFMSNNDYSLQLNRWFLKPIGGWPQMNGSSTTCKILVLLHIFICVIVVACIMIPCTLYVLFEEANIKLKLSAIGPLLHRVMGSVNYWVLLKRSGDIRKLIRHMEEDWKIINRFEDREIMLQYAKFGRFVAGICGVIMHGGAFLFSIAKAIKTVPITVGNETFRMHPMTCPIYSKIIDTRFSPVNEIALIVQFLSTFIVSSSTVGGCSLAAVFAMHACGQLNVLCAWLHELVENQEKNHKAERKLAVIVEHHLRVLRVMGSVNYWVLLKRSGDIRKLIRHMEEDWKIINKFEEREIMLQYAKFGRFVAGICGVIMHGGIWLFSLARVMKTVPVTVGNETFRTHPLTCPVYSKIIDTRFSPVNEIALVLQFMSTFVVSSSTIGGCSLAAVFATHACGQLNVLYTWLHELVENQKGNHVAERKMAAIVEHHLRVLSFLARVESIMNKISLAELMGCTISMCLMGYFFLLTLEDFNAAKITSYINVYLSMAFNIFIYCYIGEIIAEQCKHVGEMAYMTDWYNLHHKTALGLILIIARSSNVIKFTAGKLFQLSIATFGDVIKTSMVYLNLLRTLTV